MSFGEPLCVLLGLMTWLLREIIDPVISFCHEMYPSWERMRGNFTPPRLDFIFYYFPMSLSTGHIEGPFCSACTHFFFTVRGSFIFQKVANWTVKGDFQKFNHQICWWMQMWCPTLAKGFSLWHFMGKVLLLILQTYFIVLNKRKRESLNQQFMNTFKMLRSKKS